jgi:hypothetical protein
MPPLNVQAVASIDKRTAPPQGSIPAIIDLTIDDPPSDKGKQKANVEMVDAPKLARYFHNVGGRHGRGVCQVARFHRAGACMGGGAPTLGSVDPRVQGCV